MQMMRCLREVNVDDNSVGWYQSTNMGNFMNQSLIEHQYEFQQALSKSVLIIHGKSSGSRGFTRSKGALGSEIWRQDYLPGELEY